MVDNLSKLFDKAVGPLILVFLLGVTTSVWLGGDRPHAGEAVSLTHARYPQEAMAY